MARQFPDRCATTRSMMRRVDVRNALARAAAEIAHGDEEGSRHRPQSHARHQGGGQEVRYRHGGREIGHGAGPTAIRADYRGTREERVSTRSGFELREVPNGTGGTNLRFTGFACVTEAEYEMEDWLGHGGVGKRRCVCENPWRAGRRRFSSESLRDDPGPDQAGHPEAFRGAATLRLRPSTA